LAGRICTFLTHERGDPLTFGLIADRREADPDSRDAMLRDMAVGAAQNPGACAYGKIVLIEPQGICTFQATTGGDVVPAFCGNSTAAALSLLGDGCEKSARVYGTAPMPYDITASVTGEEVMQCWTVPPTSTEERVWRGLPVLLTSILNDYAIVIGRLPLDVSAGMAREELLGAGTAGKLAVVRESESGTIVEFYNTNGRHGAVPQTGAATISLAIRSKPWLGDHFSNGRVTYLTANGRRTTDLPVVSETRCGRLAIALPTISVRLDPMKVQLVA